MPSTSAWIRDRIISIVRGVNALLTRARTLVWEGGSDINIQAETAPIKALNRSFTSSGRLAAMARNRSDDIRGSRINDIRSVYRLINQ